MRYGRQKPARSGLPGARAILSGMKTNTLRELLRSRIRTLLENCRAAGELKHALTAGMLRENYLREFFRDLIPAAFRVATGFVIDADGRSTPQLDFIVYDPSALPPVVLSHDLAVLPCESVVLVAEIKSTLTTSDFSQIEQQRAALNALQYAAHDVPGGAMRIPHVVFALDCKVARTTICDWMRKCNDVMSVCVIGSFFVDRVAGELQTWQPEAGSFNETLATIFRLHNGVLDVTAMRERLKFKYEDYMFPELPADGPVAC